MYNWYQEYEVDKKIYCFEMKQGLEVKLKMKTVIKNGRLLDSKNNFHMTKADILIEDGIIKKIGENINEEGSKVIDVKNSIVAPGFIDIHVHCFLKEQQ